MDIGHLVSDLFAIIDEHRLEEHHQVLSPDLVVVAPKGTIRGVETWKRGCYAFAESYTQGKHTIERVIQSGEVAAVEGTWSGLNSGPRVTADGILPATNAQVVLPFCLVAEVHNGRLSRLTVYQDEQAMALQLKAPNRAAGNSCRASDSVQGAE